MVGVPGLPGTHTGLWDHPGETREGAGPSGGGVTEAQSQECQLFQEEIKFLGHSISARDFILSLKHTATGIINPVLCRSPLYPPFLKSD